MHGPPSSPEALEVLVVVACSLRLTGVKSFAEEEEGAAAKKKGRRKVANFIVKTMRM